MRKQWHPVFARLLRPLVEGHYDVKTDVPVGDLPRQADVVLLRRTSAGPLPFLGLWRDLTTWNVLEFKGPTVSPRRDDIDLLVEVGLGIHRRLNEERDREGEPALGPGDVSLWYLVNHLGRRFLADCRQHLGPLDDRAPGVWRCVLLGRVVFLVSGTDLPVEQDTLPLHLIGKGSAETELAVAEFLVQRPKLWQEYGSWLATLHSRAYGEVEAMAKTKRQKFDFDLEALFRAVGRQRVIEALGKEQVIEALGRKQVIEALGKEQVIELLGPESIAKALTSEAVVEQLSPATCRKLIEMLRRKADRPSGPASQTKTS